MKNLKWCKYTYLHRRAFEYCVDKLIRDPALREEMMRRAKVHDMDKMVMYLSMDQKEAQEKHTMTQPHHLENKLPKTHDDLVEAVIDYECAPYTKPDKPLNAFDFVNLLVDWKALTPEQGKALIAIMEELGIAYSGTIEEDTEGQQYIRDIGEVTEDMIREEIIRYVDEFRPEVKGEVLKLLAD